MFTGWVEAWVVIRKSEVDLGYVYSVCVTQDFGHCQDYFNKIINPIRRAY